MIHPFILLVIEGPQHTLRSYDFIPWFSLVNDKMHAVFIYCDTNTSHKFTSVLLDIKHLKIVFILESNMKKMVAHESSM